MKHELVWLWSHDLFPIRSSTTDVKVQDGQSTAYRAVHCYCNKISCDYLLLQVLRETKFARDR